MTAKCDVCGSPASNFYSMGVFSFSFCQLHHAGWIKGKSIADMKKEMS